jgi:hypothetical protein
MRTRGGTPRPMTSPRTKWSSCTDKAVCAASDGSDDFGRAQACDLRVQRRFAAPRQRPGLGRARVPN